MSRDLPVTVLYDNYPFATGLRAKWGFSCLVEGLEKTILFDTGGDGEVLLSNMVQMGKSPTDADIVILSHGHGDHTGGLASVLERKEDLVVFTPESVKLDHVRGLADSQVDVVPVREGMEVCASAYSTGELDSGIKEQSLMIETGGGLAVVTGCAHPGIVNILTAAKKMVEMPIELALGGWHLKDLNRRQLRRVVGEFRGLRVASVAPCHCSGDKTREIFAEEYGSHFINAGVGRVLEIPNGPE